MTSRMLNDGSIQIVAITGHPDIKGQGGQILRPAQRHETVVAVYPPGTTVEHR